MTLLLPCAYAIVSVVLLKKQENIIRLFASKDNKSEHP